ncbi:putative motility protein [Devosia aquimaris]|uniref:putative motility protein n=1 Tax=Devosia aquimaris TaxID=2866214 RepID=UPI001CD0A8F2|nr:putative motility protein [Devosia sp. CJK-A8-3]
MNADLSTQMLAMNTIKTQNSVQIAVFKKANEMQNELLNTLTQQALSPPLPGQGTQVDKRA